MDVFEWLENQKAIVANLPDDEKRWMNEEFKLFKKCNAIAIETGESEISTSRT